MYEENPPPGWYKDPYQDDRKHRYWDGKAWTDYVQDESPENTQPAESLLGYPPPLGHTASPGYAAPLGYSDPRANEESLKEITEGKRLLIAATALSLSISLVDILTSSDVLQGVIRLILECALWVLVYQGFNWARIVNLVLFGLGIIIGVVFIIALIGAQALTTVPRAMLEMVAMLAVYIFAFVVLLGRPIRSYQNDKRSKRRLRQG